MISEFLAIQEYTTNWLLGEELIALHLSFSICRPFFDFFTQM